MICNASERNRVLTRWLSANAVRFIGNQRFSMTIENDVSTSRATAAWLRVSVSEISTSSTVIRTAERVVATARLPRCRCRRGAEHRIRHSASDVPRLGVAERPWPRRAGQLAGRPGATRLTFPVTS